MGMLKQSFWRQSSVHVEGVSLLMLVLGCMLAEEVVGKYVLGTMKNLSTVVSH